MRWAFVVLAGCSQARADEPRVDFATQVRPILEHRCEPCHFTGGAMYARLPFDRAATVERLGEKKLFTRIKDEAERAVIRAYLAQRP